MASPFLFAQSNDNFANRALLIGGSVSVTADNSAATTELGEPINTAVMGMSLWWTWTAPASGWVNIGIAPQPYPFPEQNFYAMLWRGDSITSLTHLASITNDNPRVRPTNACMLAVPCRPPVPGNVYVQAGETLQISVAAALPDYGNPRVFTLTLDLSTLQLASPAHDALLAGPTNLVARISVPHPDIEGNIRNLAFHYFSTNTGFGGLSYLGFRESTNGLETTFLGLNSSDYWFYATAVNEAGRALTTPSHYVRVRPRNDHFHEATQITTLPFYDTFNLYNSTAELNEPILSNQITSASVWWTWTAPSNCQAIVRAFGPIGIFTGPAIDSLLPHASGSNTLRASFEAGTTYSFKVASHSSSLRIARSFELHLYPANDDFANRALLTESSSVIYGDAIVATREPFEPPGTSTLWWSWTAPADGLLNIRSVVFRSVECSVWVGDSLTNLVQLASENFQSYLPDPWPPTLSYTILRCEVEAGQTYHLRVNKSLSFGSDFGISLDFCAMRITNPAAGNFNGPTNLAIEVTAARSDIEGAVTGMMVGIGPGSIYGYPGSYATPLSGIGPFNGTITNLLPGIYSLTAWGTNSAGRFISTRSVPVRVAPWNDNFASAPSVSGWITNAQFWVGGSSTEDGEPEMDGQTNRFSVWWKWTATSNSTVLIRSHIVPIAVFDGDSLASLRPIGSRLPYAVRLDAVARTTYYIRAATDSHFHGILDVGPLLANDDFANSILLAGDNVTFLVTNSHTSIEAGEPSHVDNWDRLRGSLWWHWIAKTNGLLFLERVDESGTHVEVFSGKSLANLARQIPLDDPALPFGTVHRVRAGEQFNFAFDGTYDSTNRTFRLRFIPDPPPDRVGLIRLSPSEVCFVSQAEVGEQITIEASQDLEYWFAIDSEIATETTVYLGYRFAAHDDYMFFRAVRRPPSAQ